jgi:hypothetical protein
VHRLRPVEREGDRVLISLPVFQFEALVNGQKLDLVMIVEPAIALALKSLSPTIIMSLSPVCLLFHYSCNTSLDTFLDHHSRQERQRDHFCWVKLLWF